MADDCCNPEKEKSNNWTKAIYIAIAAFFVLALIYQIFAGDSGATTGLEHAPDMVGGC